MLTRSDLSAPLAIDPPLRVSIYLPTHVLGSETRQDPIRLKNLVSRARTELTSVALSSAITASRVRLFHATRFALSETYRPDLPQSLDDVPGESDYENPVQASPVARPHTGAMNIGNAQVYGDSPAEWRKGRLVDFTARVAAAMKRLLGEDSVPFVLAADAETGGHFQKAGDFGPLLAGVLEGNPEAMDERQLHAAAYAVVQRRLDGQRAVAVERFETLHGQTSPRAVTDVDKLVTHAVRGRVDTLLLVGDLAVWGRYDDTTKLITRSDGGTSRVTRRAHRVTPTRPRPPRPPRGAGKPAPGAPGRAPAAHAPRPRGRGPRARDR